jgi:hypothetical protein
MYNICYRLLLGDADRLIKELKVLIKRQSTGNHKNSTVICSGDRYNLRVNDFRKILVALIFIRRFKLFRGRK